MQTKLKPNSGCELLCGVYGERCFREKLLGQVGWPRHAKNNA